MEIYVDHPMFAGPDVITRTVVVRHPQKVLIEASLGDGRGCVVVLAESELKVPQVVDC